MVGPPPVTPSRSQCSPPSCISAASGFLIGVHKFGKIQVRGSQGTPPGQQRGPETKKIKKTQGKTKKNSNQR